MALQQINLKVSDRVATHWRAQAAAAGLSVRDWLVSITAPTAEPPAAPDDLLAERVTRLEKEAAAMKEALTLLQSRPLPAELAPRSPRPIPAAPVPLPAEELPTGGIETAELAERLGMRRGSLNERVRRQGGARAGLVVAGWRCLGLRPSGRGGPDRALWVPVESEAVPGSEPAATEQPPRPGYPLSAAGT